MTEQDLIRAYNQKDDMAFDRCVQRLLNGENLVQEKFQALIDEWLNANEKQPEDVRWGRFPLGMVQGWVQRAIDAERKLRSTP